MKDRSIRNVSESILEELKRYIRSQYNISNPFVIRQRDKLLDKEGLIFREPFIENTPKYKLGDKFSSINLPPAFEKIIEELSSSDKGNKLIFDPPYSHQLGAVKNTLVDNKSTVIMTGTGSGKTESFLWPILGKLAREADESSETFKQPAVRALVLYPMNALVNDQLGRMRSLFGDQRLKKVFQETSSKRIPTFARYTSRTPYSGKRTATKDRQRFEGYKQFYVAIEKGMNDPLSPDQEKQKQRKEELTTIGKWPAKESVKDWFEGRTGNRAWGEEGDRLKKNPLDSELLSRHEAQLEPPDILVTNFSMLSYMMLRPIEKNIFYQTKQWLKTSKNEKFIIVFDEAHLYSGSQGAEVSLLIRRLINRLGIRDDQLQIIITSASFSDKDKAKKFASQLSSLNENHFEVFEGRTDLNESTGELNQEQYEILSKIDFETFQGSFLYEDKRNAIQDFLKYRNINIKQIETEDELRSKIFDALVDFPPLNKLINESMGSAKTIDEMIELIFPSDTDKNEKERVLSLLLSMASYARKSTNPRSLFPARLHLFLRGLPGLWACLNQDCSEIDQNDRGNSIGKLYSQPVDKCDCGSHVFEYLTCRYCGSDFAKAFIDDVDNDTKSNQPLWANSGETYRSEIYDAEKIKYLNEFHIYLGDIEEFAKKTSGKIKHSLKLADFDPCSSRLNPKDNSTARPIKYAETEFPENDDTKKHKRRFILCPVCREEFYRDQKGSPVQDHQTKGVEPLKAIAAETISTQPPSKESTSRNPLGGRKLLFFSDSREKAASLVKRFNDFGARDSMRPMIALGFEYFSKSKVAKRISLDDIYKALHLGSRISEIRLRFNETPDSYFQHENWCFENMDNPPTEDQLVDLSYKNWNPDNKIVEDLVTSVLNTRFGLYPLAIAQLRENESEAFDVSTLLEIPKLAETEQQKKHLIRIWLYFWAISRSTKQRRKPWFGFMSNDEVRWMDPPDKESYYIVGYSPGSIFRKLRAFLKKFRDSNAEEIFKTNWLPQLIEHFTEPTRYTNENRLIAEKLCLSFHDEDWGICSRCRSVQVKADHFDQCIHCDHGKVLLLNPDREEVFLKNNEYARQPIKDALITNKNKVYSLTTKEHTAQLNATSTSDKIFSEAEQNELSFQDIQYDESLLYNIVSTDILSSTTTMEVGIDIGALSAVGLRGMPPARSNYQQRAGRAGRRGNSIATVVSWGNVDSHDEHYFSNPREMISGEVKDPFINLSNIEIAERHVISFLLEKFLEEMPDKQLEQDGNIGVYDVLGTVPGFRKNSPDNSITFEKLEDYVAKERIVLEQKLNDWLPDEMKDDRKLIDLDVHLDRIKCATDDWKLFETLSSSSDTEDGDSELHLEPSETPNSDANDRGEESSFIDPKNNKLLPRLMLKGVLPKYGFPFDIVSLHVFSKKASQTSRFDFRYQPTLPLSSAIRLYAPGETTTIGGKIYKTHGIYSINSSERKAKYNESRTLYSECTNCGFSEIDSSRPDELKDKKTSTIDICDNCNQQTFGPPKWRLEPVGFVHGYKQPQLDTYQSKTITNKRTNVRSRYTPNEETHMVKIGGSGIITAASDKGWIQFTNTGPDDEGFDYCLECGWTTQSAIERLHGDQGHKKPYPDAEVNCSEAQYISRGISLGTEFITDLLYINFDFQHTDIDLVPGNTNAKVILATVAEALARAAANLLQIESSEISSLYRHENSDVGLKGKKFDIILFDTLANGAGYCTSQEIDKEELIEEAIRILKECPENCDSSCYRCLRQYSNKYEHHIFDRYLGQLFLETALSGSMPDFENSRILQSLHSIEHDVKKYGFEGRISINEERTINGETYEIPLIVSKDNNELFYGLSNPLTKGKFFDQDLQDWRDMAFGNIQPISELEVRKSLPQVTKSIIKDE